MKVLVIVRALNEGAAVGTVVRELRDTLPTADVLVVDDGSVDGTATAAGRAGALVMRLPRTVGMCAAAQRGYRFALAAGYDAALQVDGDGQHRAGDAAALLAQVTSGRASLALGSRFLAPDAAGHRSTPLRRVGNRLLSRSMSALTGQRITDATSGLRAVDRRGIAVFARDYPRDEVEAASILLAWRSGLRITELPVVMRPRLAGRSTISAGRSAYYGWRAARELAGLATGRAPRLQREAA